MNDLEARITRLEDIEAIRQLKALYCDICDDDHNPGRIVEIFTEDGIWEGRGIGKATGLQEIRELFAGFQRAIRFSQHMVQNPMIEIDGDCATGRWYFLGMFTMEKDGKPLWQSCRYEETYRRTSDGWKIAHLKIRGPTVAALHETGWQK